MKRLVLMLLVICLLPGAAGAFAGEGTRLDPSSLPEDWALVGEYSASPAIWSGFLPSWAHRCALEKLPVQHTNWPDPNQLGTHGDRDGG